jgi:hypothetical protein
MSVYMLINLSFFLSSSMLNIVNFDKRKNKSYVSYKHKILCRVGDLIIRIGLKKTCVAYPQEDFLFTIEFKKKIQILEILKFKKKKFLTSKI